MKRPIRLLLVDDHGIFLEGLASLLSTSEIEIAHMANNGQDALDWLETNAADLILTDLNMPEMDGVELVKKVKGKYPDQKILILTMHNDRSIISEIVMVEAEGYVLKDSSKKELVKAILQVMEGNTYYSNEVMKVILDRMEEKIKQHEAEIKLTQRELEVLLLIAEEKSSDEIAKKLHISKRTVDTHRKNLLRKTGKSTVVGLLKYGYQNGLINLDKK